MRKGGLCTCKNPHCLGRDPKRSSILHRVPGAVVIGWASPYVQVHAPGRKRTAAYHLVPGLQIRHPIIPGQKGTIEYMACGSSALHYFVAEEGAVRDSAVVVNP